YEFLHKFRETWHLLGSTTDPGGHVRLQRAFSIFTVAASMIAGSALPALATTTPAPATSPPAEPPQAPGCDPIAGADCLLPFPNDWSTTAARTPTGRRLALTSEMTPRNAAGKSIDPAAWNLSDGFSPGSMLLVQVPGLDLAATGAAPITDIGRSLRRDAP